MIDNWEKEYFTGSQHSVEIFSNEENHQKIGKGKGWIANDYIALVCKLKKEDSELAGSEATLGNKTPHFEKQNGEKL